MKTPKWKLRAQAKFPNLVINSRQRLYQLENQQAGICISCGKAPKVKGRFCGPCYERITVLNRETQRARNASKNESASRRRNYSCASYALSSKKAAAVNSAARSLRILDRGDRQAILSGQEIPNEDSQRTLAFQPEDQASPRVLREEQNKAVSAHVCAKPSKEVLPGSHLRKRLVGLPTD